MQLQINTPTYNERRFGKPWIARVTFSTPSKAEFAWGDWVGDPGYKGLYVIDVEPGQVIAIGQRDMRKPANSAPRFFIVPDQLPAAPLEDDYSATLEEAGFKRVDKKDAYLHLTSK